METQDSNVTTPNENNSENIVDSNEIVASTSIPGNVHMVNLVNELNIDAEQSESCMLFKVGDSVKKEQILNSKITNIYYSKEEIQEQIKKYSWIILLAKISLLI